MDADLNVTARKQTSGPRAGPVLRHARYTAERGQTERVAYL
jgi:hypothetical protein